MIEHIFDRTVLHKQFRCGLRPHTGHPRNVVRTVSHQPFHINEADRRESILLLKRRRIVGTRLTDSLFRQHDGEPCADQLQCVTVARHNDGWDPLCRRLRCECADDVVRLVAIQFEEGNAERCRQFL